MKSEKKFELPKMRLAKLNNRETTGDPNFFIKTTTTNNLSDFFSPDNKPSDKKNIFKGTKVKCINKRRLGD